MKTLNEIADFIENHVIECKPNTGCGRCDEARECLSSLRALANKPYTAVSGSLPLASEEIQRGLIEFFRLEAELKHCSNAYYERVKWYFETYQDELFGLPKRASESNDR